MTVRRKIFWISVLIIVAAVAIVLCVGYFTGRHPSEYEGTLVRLNFDFPRLL